MYLLGQYHTVGAWTAVSHYIPRYCRFHLSSYSYAFLLVCLDVW